MKMKKVLCLVLALVLALGVLAGCGGGNVKTSAKVKDFKHTDEKLENIGEGFSLDIAPKQRFIIIILLSAFLIWFYIKCYIDIDIIIYDDYTNYRFFWEDLGFEF